MKAHLEPLLLRYRQAAFDLHDAQARLHQVCGPPNMAGSYALTPPPVRNKPPCLTNTGCSDHLDCPLLHKLPPFSNNETDFETDPAERHFFHIFPNCRRTQAILVPILNLN